ARCTDWLEGHNCIQDGCPHQDDDLICPSGFWGFRYQVEQVPAGIGDDPQPEAQQIPVLIDNCDETRVHLSYYKFKQFPAEQQKFQQWQAEGNILLLESAEKQSFRQQLTEAVASGTPPHLIYFYAHGGQEAQLGPYVRLGSENEQPNEYLTLLDLTRAGVRAGAFSSNPLVFINTCDSGAYGPGDYSNILQRFYRAGACGLVATECTVYEPIAQAMSGRFFNHFLRGKPAGQALWLASHELIRQHNPAGLFYALFALSQTILRCPVLPQVEVDP
ncbi:MAG: CHAT domain-containing protein, partial [Anaerolineales bacterium]|nr:CHAT domain-containing protein [Anaerolineales bacterium]